MGCHRRVLYLRHHRQSQGRGHAPPRGLSQRGEQRRHLEHAAISDLPVDVAAVPLQRLVLPVDGRDAGRHAGVSAQGGEPRNFRCHARACCGSLLRRPNRAQPAGQRGSRAARGSHAAGARHGGRRCAPGGDDRGHGEDRFRAHPCLRADRDLRPGGGRCQARAMGRGEPVGADPAQRPPGRALRPAGGDDGARSGDHDRGSPRRTDAR